MLQVFWMTFNEHFYSDKKLRANFHFDHEPNKIAIFKSELREMLTIHLDLINHKLLSKLEICESYINQRLSCNLICVLVPVIPDTSGIHRTKTLSFCPWPYQTRPVGAGQRQLIHCLWFFVLALVFLLCPASQQINCSTRELLKAPYGKHDNYQVKLISHFQYFINMPICEPLSTKHTKWLS